MSELTFVTMLERLSVVDGSRTGRGDANHGLRGKVNGSCESFVDPPNGISDAAINSRRMDKS